MKLELLCPLDFFFVLYFSHIRTSVMTYFDEIVTFFITFFMKENKLPDENFRSPFSTNNPFYNVWLSALKSNKRLMVICIRLPYFKIDAMQIFVVTAHWWSDHPNILCHIFLDLFLSNFFTLLHGTFKWWKSAFSLPF